ncbi:MAG: hypothetical protein WA771_13945 [Chthoniobacterales bacterium]
MKTITLKLLATILVSAAVAPLSSQAGTSPVEGQFPSVTIKPEKGMSIESLQVRSTARGSLVSGRVERAFGASLRAGSHVCVEVRRADGSLITNDSVRLTPSGHPRVLGAWIGRSTFATTVAAPIGATITLSAHSGRHS